MSRGGSSILTSGVDERPHRSPPAKRGPVRPATGCRVAYHGRWGQKKSEINPLGSLSHLACRISCDMRQPCDRCDSRPALERVSHMSQVPKGVLDVQVSRCGASRSSRLTLTNAKNG
jgi:hypothetical protein